MGAMTSSNTLPEPLSAEALTLPKSDQNLVWIDCEMSGLDPEAERLLEVAVVVPAAPRSAHSDRCW